MPEVIEDPKTKEKKLIDWMGRPISSAQEAEQKRTTNYLYDMYHLGKNLRGMTDPNKRGDNLADLQKNLQAQYYGREGLAGDYVTGESNLAVEKSRGQTLRDVAETTGRYGVQAAEAGKSSQVDNTALLAAMLTDKTPDPLVLAGDKEKTSVIDTTASDIAAKKKKIKDAQIARKLGVLPGNIQETDASLSGALSGAGSLFGKILKDDPDFESWKKDYFR